MEVLLILDVNGVLCHKTKNSTGQNIVTLPTYQIAIRPYGKEFLQHCYENYTVGYLSSTPTKNLKNILNAILTDEQRNRTLFFWGRDRTHFDPDGIGRHDTVKYIHDVISNPYVNNERKYNMRNTIIVEDSYRKVRFNPEDNVVVVPEYKGDEIDSELKRAEIEIGRKFLRLLSK